jgi:hypothetical protein
MYFAYCFECDVCGDEIESQSNADSIGRCNNCDCETGTYRKTGEIYDQEYVDQEKYNDQQDREYEERHRYD